MKSTQISTWRQVFMIWFKWPARIMISSSSRHLPNSRELVMTRRSLRYLQAWKVEGLAARDQAQETHKSQRKRKFNRTSTVKRTWSLLLICTMYRISKWWGQKRQPLQLRRRKECLIPHHHPKLWNRLLILPPSQFTMCSIHRKDPLNPKNKHKRQLDSPLLVSRQDLAWSPNLNRSSKHLP